MTRAGALIVAAALGGCQPVIYELLDSASGAGGSTEHGTTTMSPTTGPGSAADPTVTGEPPESCKDGGQDGEETDVDCGGPLCPPCEAGATCAVPEDCASGLCDGGSCAPAPQCVESTDCPPVPCRAASCSPQMQCVYTDLEGAGCDDGDLCTEGDVCEAGQCKGTAKDCGALDDVCQVGFCNPQTGNCGLELLDGQPCEDGEMCTFDAFCSQGVCAGKTFPPLFFEDFSAPRGWFIDDPWEIGPAAPSACADNGFEDPAEDHSPGPDNMLAGAAIGGCLSDQPLPPEACLTSPPINAMVPGPVWLTFWSKLSATPGPGGARVEVFTGNSWQPIFDTMGQSFDEPDWELHTLDISMYKGFGLGVRFCHHVPEPGLPIVSGWSVDDVYVGAPGCEP